MATNMAASTPAALLLISLFLFTGSCDPLAASTFEETMESINLDVADDGPKVANANDVQTSTLWDWGPPVSSWPAKFCLWDYWTTAAWQITFVGKHGVCDAESGSALAGLASRAIAANTGIQSMLKGLAWAPVTTTPVLCQARAGQLIYTVRLEAPSPAMAKFRASSGTQLMKSLLKPADVRTLKFPGTTAELPWLTVLGG